MTVTRLLAQMIVTDLPAAIAWYSALFDRDPDARPMDGLVEWHLAEEFGVQVWAEPARAGHSSMVLDESDLDARMRTSTAPDFPTAIPSTRRRPGSCCWPIPTATGSSSPESSRRDAERRTARPDACRGRRGQSLEARLQATAVS